MLKSVKSDNWVYYKVFFKYLIYVPLNVFETLTYYTVVYVLC